MVSETGSAKRFRPQRNQHLDSHLLYSRSLRKSADFDNVSPTRHRFLAKPEIKAYPHLSLARNCYRVERPRLDKLMSVSLSPSARTSFSLLGGDQTIIATSLVRLKACVVSLASSRKSWPQRFKKSEEQRKAALRETSLIETRLASEGARYTTRVSHADSPDRHSFT